MIDVNVKGVANVVRSFVPAMVARAEGVVVNISSGLGRSTNPMYAAYCASKFAVEALTKSMAQALPDGMAAVPLAPGIITTEMQEAKIEATKKRKVKNKLVRFGWPTLLPGSRSICTPHLPARRS